MKEEISENQKKKAPRRGRRVFSILLILVLTFVVIALAGAWDMKINLHGSEAITIEYGEEYKDSGASVEFQNRVFPFLRLEEDLEAEGTVDPDMPGEYVLTYRASRRNMSAEASRIVTVRAPENDLSYLYSWAANPTQEKALLADPSAVESGNGDSQEQPIQGDRERPVIHLYGGSPLTVYREIGWKDAYLATDDTDGDITGKVEVEGSFDPTTVGTYQLTYRVADRYGNQQTAVRTIHVQDFPKENTKKEYTDEEIHTIFLTFDDGPGPHTERLLDILAAHEAKVTFFVTNGWSNYASCIKREAEEGHAIAVHTSSHKYSNIYANDDAFWNDYNAIQNVIKEQTGCTTRLMRFPGGVSNTVSKKYCSGIMTRLANEATQRGYWYYDWNIVSGDAGETRDSAEIYRYMTEGVVKATQKKEPSIVLCHDIHEFTVNAMEDFLTWGEQNGYQFKPLEYGTFAAHDKINN